MEASCFLIEIYRISIKLKRFIKMFRGFLLLLLLFQKAAHAIVAATRKYYFKTNYKEEP